MLHYTFHLFVLEKLRIRDTTKVQKTVTADLNETLVIKAQKRISWGGHKIGSSSLSETLLLIGKSGDLVALKSAQRWLKADSWFSIAGSASVMDDPYALST